MFVRMTNVARRWWPIALLVAPLATGGRLRAAVGHASWQEAPGELAGVRSWESLLIRDQRVSFSPGTRISALAALDNAATPAAQRAAALYALGAGRFESERPRLEAALKGGDSDQRCAALLGLGELGSGDLTSLGQYAREPDLLLSGCAVLGLLRSGRPTARNFVEELARADTQAARQAADLIVFHLDRSASRESPPTRRLLDLRWEAGARFGLVDGENWVVLSVRELSASDPFLDELVYLAASESPRDGVRDHLLEILIQEPSELIVRACVRRMPTQMSKLVEANLWTPKHAQAWGIVLDEIQTHQLELQTPLLLRKALTFEQARWRAAVLLLRSGDKGALEIIESELPNASPTQKVQLLDALGASHDLALSKLVARTADDPDPAVQSSAIVARFLIGDRGAEDALRRMLDEGPPDDPARLELISAMCRQARWSEVLPYLSRLSIGPDSPSKIEVLIALVARGRAQGRDELRAVIRRDPASPQSLRCLRALCQAPAIEDLALVRELFPVPGATELNQLLGLCLVRQKDAAVQPLLRAALWRTPVPRSLLAASLLVDTAGMDALRAELLSPPAGITARDLRRVGYALGAWGGLDQVHWLSERQNAGDPALQGALLGALGARTF